MDEILIEDKKYVSSKRAAKITGYAKDYIGQLCREGRVSARLVGRSWYVLESAIQDHRFGDPSVTQKAAPEKEKAVLSSTWESPRYEASSVESFPSVNRLHERPKPVVEQAVEQTATAAQHLQETWQAWFDRFDHAPAPVTAEVPVDIENVEPEQSDQETEPEPEPEAVPIRAIHHTAYQPPKEDSASLEQTQRQEDQEIGEEEEGEDEFQPVGNRRGKIRALRAFQLTATLLAVFMLAAAALGTGYFDTYYLISNKQVGLFAGVSFYNK